MEAETMVLYPAPVPNPVLPRAASGFSGRGMFPGGNRNLNWRAEGLRAQPHGICTAPDCVEHSAPPAAFYKKQREAAPYLSRRKFNRKSPSRRPHRRVPYSPPSPQYNLVSSPEDEAEQAPTAKGKYTDPTPTPIPRDETGFMDQDEAGKGSDSQGYSTPPEAVGIPTQRKHTVLTNILDKAVQELEEKSGPRPSSSKNQGGGDREPTPAPQHLHQGELNLATERWFQSQIRLG